FYGDVDVFNQPTENIDEKIDPDQLPPGAMHLHCEKLNVLSHRHADGHTTQEMEAHHKVVVNAQEFWGRADVVKYDESKQLVIFEGGENSMATLHRTQVQAGERPTLTGKKIFYYRKTNKVHV